MYQEISIRSFLARLETSTRNANRSPYLFKYLMHGPRSPHANIFLTLADTLFFTGQCGEIQQPLVLHHIQNDGLGTATDGKHNRPLRFLELPQDVRGVLGEYKQRLILFLSFEHRRHLTNTLPHPRPAG